MAHVACLLPTSLCLCDTQLLLTSDYRLTLFPSFSPLDSASLFLALLYDSLSRAGDITGSPHVLAGCELNNAANWEK